MRRATQPARAISHPLPRLPPNLFLLTNFQALSSAAMIIFLDFDGVLHPSPTAGDTVFCCLPHLWTILRARPDIEVVFSSSWREVYDPDMMLDFITTNGGEDLLPRFIGSNPVLVNNQCDYQREAECLAWLRGNGMLNRPWLALDDDSGKFRNPTHLYLVDRQTGLTSADVTRILARVRL